MQTWKGPSQMVESNSRASQSEVEPHRCAAPAIFNSCEQYESTAPLVVQADSSYAHTVSQMTKGGLHSHQFSTQQNAFGMWWNRRLPFVIFYNISPQILLINNFCLLTIKICVSKKVIPLFKNHNSGVKMTAFRSVIKCSHCTMYHFCVHTNAHV